MNKPCFDCGIELPLVDGLRCFECRDSRDADSDDPEPEIDDGRPVPNSRQDKSERRTAFESVRGRVCSLCTGPVPVGRQTCRLCVAAIRTTRERQARESAAIPHDPTDDRPF